MPKKRIPSKPSLRSRQTSPSAGARSEYDNPWKEMMDLYLPEFLQLLFPEVHAAIDWSESWKVCNVALRKLSRVGPRGNRLADAAYYVRLHDGRKQLLLIHIEVQGQRESGFARRMFEYYYRFYDREKGPVVSLAVLTDANPDWCSGTFNEQLLGSGVSFVFPVARLADYADQIPALEQSDNPFAMVLLGHLRHQKWRKDPQELKRAKVAIIKALLGKGWSPERINDVFKFLDWVLALPEKLEAEFEQEITVYQRGTDMKFISPWERRAMERARLQGLEEGERRGMQRGVQEGVQKGVNQTRIETLEMILRKRFGRIPVKIRQQIKRAEAEQLKAWIDRSLDAASIAEVFS